ncbi:MFS transporter [Gryllotalpicola ginsengisoli]|uniref:MFS transporter n=1 Tax=Gryllotalpicola ginsengisoli TaxID=444608 RepID=UPI0003B741EB|nr:MFS transporter [Gryllotalpicola ginsengisoli]
MPTALAPLRFAPFRWLALARTVNMLGNAVAPVALAFAVLDLGYSATDLGIVVAARSVPNVALLLVGGVIADRMPRQLVLVGSSVFSFLTQAAVAALVLARADTLAWLIVLSVVNGSLTALSQPASAGITPQTVPPEVRRPAIVLLRLGFNLAATVGAAAGAALVAWIGSGWGIAVDAATFGLAGVFFALMGLALPRDATSQEPERQHPIRDLVEGWREFTSREWVWVIVAQFLVINACFGGALSVLGPVIADETFGRADWGLIVGAETLGLVAGGFLAMRWHPRRAIGVGVALTLVWVLPLAVLGLWPAVALLVALFFVAGMATEQFEVAWDQSLQHHVPAARLSRVYSYDALGSYAAIPLGQIVAGPLADATSPRAVLLGASVLVLLVTLAALSRRSVRETTNEAAAAA